MNESENRGQPWTSQEVDLVVADYFDMLRMELTGEAFIKSRHNEALQELIKRSKGSIEFKHQNISAVLMLLGEPRIAGYKPMRNFQKSLIDGIERYLEHRKSFDPRKSYQTTGLTEENTALFIEEAPQDIENAADDDADPALSRLIRKFDPAKRDEANRTLGKAGEEKALHHEHWRLKQAGRADLAKRVRWVSQEDGDGAGYDIQSFTASGEERLLEVKTTMGHSRTPFYLSQNEKEFAEERVDALRIFRLYDFASVPRAFELTPPLENRLVLRPTNYQASFRRSSRISSSHD